ncbi:hypothetical protein LIA77_03930 [Sarocladium implicatum]|nr:hypothetical protein LIA77_03930 [Sarocladium implicatum]
MIVTLDGIESLSYGARSGRAWHSDCPPGQKFMERHSIPVPSHSVSTHVWSKQPVIGCRTKRGEMRPKRSHMTPRQVGGGARRALHLTGHSTRLFPRSTVNDSLTWNILSNCVANRVLNWT